jgi:hypothetical protein
MEAGAGADDRAHHLKRRVASGELDAGEVILAHPWTVESMPLAELLVCQPSWGPTRCRTFLGSLGLDDSKTLGVLTNRQRIAVAVALSTKPLAPSSK